MKSCYSFFQMILIFSFFAGCERNTNPFIPDDYKNAFYPLHIGNQWTYNQQYPSVETVTSSAIFAGKTYFNIEGSQLLQPEFWIREHENVIYFFDKEKNSEYKLFDFRADPGTEWDLPGGYGCNFGERIEVVSRAETLDTPLGSFSDCYHFHHIGGCADGGVEDTWFVRGVGLVKSVHEFWSGYREFYLVGYTLLPSHMN